MSKVYFMNDRSTSPQESLVAKMLTLFEAAGFDDIIKPGDTVAIKLHMGEYNNTAYIRPVYVRALVERVKALGGDPMVVDTTTLIAGPYVSRATALDYLKTAERHGFTSSSMGCPVIIADGYLGTDDVRVDLPEGVILKEQYVASAIALADVMIALSHFKGHPMGPYGGAMKNIGVGCASKRGKFCLHLSKHPKWGLENRSFDPSICKGRSCPKASLCESVCPQNCFSMNGSGIEWDSSRCISCFGCLLVITCGILGFPDGYFEATAATIVDSARAVVKTFGEKKVGFLNLALDIAPWCDCIGFSDRPLVPNIGVFASFDPVALDAACVQKVQESAGLPGSVAEDNGVLEPGTHKFTACSSFGGISEEIPLNTGVKNGLGAKEFELIEVSPASDDGKFIYPTEICGPKFNKLFRTKPVVPEEGFKRVEDYDFATLEG
ncbi:MAG: DUF362 domain-containing protein [Candidatus Tectomicrobia bacterium]|uniref:DUF362 domain-containing protein n=1 Tax=Tectimicrobiota bacterium TaxID=2528274 RepID=A0A932CPV0_UNCTE|nr:DUF362 domain-containing protein [Candidatus Tectomicrobia bacterium]